METNAIPDGDHHPLQPIPSNRRKLTANGTIWPKSFSRCVSNLQRRNHTIIPTGCPLTGHRAGTLFRASQFLSEELPIRLAHRVKELNQLPDGLSDMPSIRRVANWYMQSFEVGNLYTHSLATKLICSNTNRISQPYKSLPYQRIYATN